MDILKYKRNVLDTFIGLLLFTIAVYAYKFYHPFAYPGLESRAVWFTVLVGFLTVLYYMPYDALALFRQRMDGFFSRQKVKHASAVEGIRVLSRALNVSFGVKRESVLVFESVLSGLFAATFVYFVLQSVGWLNLPVALVVGYYVGVSVEKSLRRKSPVVEDSVVVQKTRGEYVTESINWVFQAVLVLFLLTLLVQEYQPKWVEGVKTDYLLVAVVFFGVASVLTSKNLPEKKPEPASKKDYLFAVAAGMVGAILIYIKVRDLGWLSYAISLLSGVLIILLSVLMLEEEAESSPQQS